MKDRSRERSYDEYPYSEEACLNACYIHFFFSSCCDFSERDGSREDSCSVAEMLGCYSTQLRDFYLGKANCLCVPVCERKHYPLHVTSSLFGTNLIPDIARLRGWPVTDVSELRERYIEMQFYFSTLTYTERKQKPAYTPWDLFSSAGGILGLFLGASVLSVLEVCDFFCTAASKKCCSVGKMRVGMGDITKVRVVPKANNGGDMTLQDVLLLKLRIVRRRDRLQKIERHLRLIVERTADSKRVCTLGSDAISEIT